MNARNLRGKSAFFLRYHLFRIILTISGFYVLIAIYLLNCPLNACVPTCEQDKAKIADSSSLKLESVRKSIY